MSTGNFHNCLTGTLLNPGNLVRSAVGICASRERLVVLIVIVELFIRCWSLVITAACSLSLLGNTKLTGK